jgi:hypothetical protein
LILIRWLWPAQPAEWPQRHGACRLHRRGAPLLGVRALRVRCNDDATVRPAALARTRSRPHALSPAHAPPLALFPSTQASVIYECACVRSAHGRGRRCLLLALHACYIRASCVLHVCLCLSLSSGGAMAAGWRGDGDWRAAGRATGHATGSASSAAARQRRRQQRGHLRGQRRGQQRGGQRRGQRRRQRGGRGVRMQKLPLRLKRTLLYCTVCSR